MHVSSGTPFGLVWAEGNPGSGSVSHPMICYIGEVRQNLATDPRLPFWDTTSPGQSVKAGDPAGYFFNSLAIWTRAVLLQ